jgi:hypothetical protein
MCLAAASKAVAYDFSRKNTFLPQANLGHSTASQTGNCPIVRRLCLRAMHFGQLKLAVHHRQHCI